MKINYILLLETICLILLYMATAYNLTLDLLIAVPASLVPSLWYLKNPCSIRIIVMQYILIVLCILSFAIF